MSLPRPRRAAALVVPVVLALAGCLGEAGEAATEPAPPLPVEMWFGNLGEDAARVEMTLRDNLSGDALANASFVLEGGAPLAPRAHASIERPATMDLVVEGEDGASRTYAFEVPGAPEGREHEPLAHPPGSFLRVWVHVEGGGVTHWGFAVCGAAGEEETREVCGPTPFASDDA